MQGCCPEKYIVSPVTISTAAGAGRARLILGQAGEGRAGAGAFAQAMRAVEAFDGFGVEVEPGTLLQDRPVPFHAKGLEFSQDLPGGAGSSTRQVEIFDAYEPLASMGARVEVAADRGHQRAKVQGTAG